MGTKQMILFRIYFLRFVTVSEFISEFENTQNSVVAFWSILAYKIHFFAKIYQFGKLFSSISSRKGGS